MTLKINDKQYSITRIVDFPTTKNLHVWSSGVKLLDLGEEDYVPSFKLDNKKLAALCTKYLKSIK